MTGEERKGPSLGLYKEKKNLSSKRKLKYLVCLVYQMKFYNGLLHNILESKSREE